MRGALALTAAVVAVVLGGAPAAAADGSERCPSAADVLVVVDFAELGGGVSHACRPAGGLTAVELFEDSGFAITDVQRQPGFVCRVSGKPVEDPCVITPPDDAYWGLWWSDAGADPWTYASVGAGSLTVPDGGAVALAWHDGGEPAPPAVPPPGESGAGQRDAAQGADPAPPSPTGSEDGLPAWVAPVLVGALFASAAAVAALRRRRVG